MFKRYEQIYSRYNGINVLDYFEISYKTVLHLLKDNSLNEFNFGSRVDEIVRMEIQDKYLEFDELSSLMSFPQPNSFMINLMTFLTIIEAIDDSFFIKINITRETISRIAIATLLYLLSLQTFKYGEILIPKKSKENLFKNTNFLIGIEEIKKIYFEVSNEQFNVFLELFSNNLNENIEKLLDKKIIRVENAFFTISINDFLKFLSIKIESMYKENVTTQEYSRYQNRKGKYFEDQVFELSKIFFPNIYQSVCYNPNKSKEAEIDVLIKDKENLIIVECKSGTINLENINKDEEILLKIKNKLKKAYITLKHASDYLGSNSDFLFKNNHNEIFGFSKDYKPIFIHISMYPFDSVSSNLHTLSYDFINNDIPIISLSFEHYLCILHDCYLFNESFTDYLQKRMRIIKDKPNLILDTNELDLYYQLKPRSKKSMLQEALDNDFFATVSSDVKIFTSFHDLNGNEFRPAKNMINKIDVFLLDIFLHNKLVINKKYINSFLSCFTTKSQTKEKGC